MGAPTVVSESGRLKREDFKWTKHDSAFSNWKLLIGASDWKDHSLGREGAEKYRTHNLPNCTFCPGVYELGIALPRLPFGGETRKLDPSSVVPVYLGQADNVRNRLQQYGRDGAHLGNRHLDDKTKIHGSVVSNKGTGYFVEIFSKGFSIVYRWAPMKSKKDAEKTESQLLDIFDYAWNKGSNGARRPDDVFKKLNNHGKMSHFSFLSEKLRVFNTKRVGVEIGSCKPFSSETSDHFISLSTESDKNGFFSRIFKIPRPQATESSPSIGPSHICGVSVGQGSICTNSPLNGRKRCAEHRGMKVNGLISKLQKDEFEKQSFHDNNVSHQSYTICGVTMDDGSVCEKQPVLRNKRCSVHKGRKVSSSAPKPLMPETKEVLYNRSSISKYGEGLCGIILADGKPCTEPSISGRRRCHIHKGMRLKCHI